MICVCAAEGCGRSDRIKRGYCNRHYEQLRRQGKIAIREANAELRFWGRVKKSKRCWLWTGAKASGYGRLQFQGKPMAAHRLAYELVVGPIPDGLDLDHLCRNRACVRPDHLEPVTRQVNILRGEGIPAQLAARALCPNRHEFTPENTYRWRSARYCRTCRREATVRASAARPTVFIAAVCVICKEPFEFERRKGTVPNVCSERCRQVRKRAASRDYQRRKRGMA